VRVVLPRLLFAAAAIFCLTPYASPGLALALGVGLACTLGNPWPALVRRVTRPLLQVSVVLLGFGMSLVAVLTAGREGFLLAAATILLTFLASAVFRRALRLAPSTAVLLSAGTAICGGSAIAAVGLAITAAESEMSVALGTVFLLNAVALYLFPLLGHALGLSQHQFGTWSGIAIHDVSSVVGAASAYGQQALQTATAVKLSRTLWIVPIALAAGVLVRPTGDGLPAGGRRHTLVVPWFVGLFVLASLAGTLLPSVHRAAATLQAAARTGMTLTLLLIGASLSRSSLRAVGVRAVVHGLALWLLVGLVSLAAVVWLGA
jgi:uncharacterized integral membrane protein (TIGR00698 family)